MLTAQEKAPNYTLEVKKSKLTFLGKTKKVVDAVKRGPTSKVKKDGMRRMKQVPENFVGRKRGESRAERSDLEHQGEDPLWQKKFKTTDRSPIDPNVNIEGVSFGFGSPQDPSGDVSRTHYVQATNLTRVGVFDREGNLELEFAMNDLWTDLGVQSAGDPIVLYDDEAETWIITEFTDPANILIAISETSDPLGAYMAYSFATPQFPDYPKYGLTPDALTITTNESGAGVLTNYFIDLRAMYAGEAAPVMLSATVAGNNTTEAGFYVATPADFNGANAPFDNRPITMKINDSSWGGGPAQDQVELFTFDVDFAAETVDVEVTEIPLSPFDGFPCSATGPGFACMPQLGGQGLDGVPEVIMNVPHQRNLFPEFVG